MLPARCRGSVVLLDHGVVSRAGGDAPLVGMPTHGSGDGQSPVSRGVHCEVLHSPPFPVTMGTLLIGPLSSVGGWVH